MSNKQRDLKLIAFENGGWAVVDGDTIENRGMMQQSLAAFSNTPDMLEGLRTIIDQRDKPQKSGVVNDG